MKIGIRTPSPTKSLKARTTGRIKRTVKSSYNPIYGEKGVGYLKDPERAIKNKVYHKMTVDSLDSIKHDEKRSYNPDITDVPKVERIKKPHPILVSVLAIISLICTFYTLYADVTAQEFHGLIFLFGIICAVVALILGFRK